CGDFGEVFVCNFCNSKINDQKKLIYRPSTARRSSKVKSQKSKVLLYRLLIDFKWLSYLRRTVLVT
ncbi:hypothetical protein, partial [Nodularia spumigena]|uniref:hypothetical protein n=1 Tax=Nodularia spumigena TaxID=70799 RepID=UPI0030D88A4F